MLCLKGKRILLAAALFLLAAGGTLLAGGVDAGAKIKEVSALENPQWTMVGQASVTQEDGWLQSMCVTDHYIICFENTSNRKGEPDTLLAFYKNDYDENGNPVQRYSLAKTVAEMDYEHGNGMTITAILMRLSSLPANPGIKRIKGLCSL